MCTQVAKFDACDLEITDEERDSVLRAWWDAVPPHMQISKWVDVKDWNDPEHAVLATFTVESKARLRAAGKYVGPLEGRCIKHGPAGMVSLRPLRAGTVVAPD